MDACHTQLYQSRFGCGHGTEGVRKHFYIAFGLVSLSLGSVTVYSVFSPGPFYDMHLYQVRLCGTEELEEIFM